MYIHLIDKDSKIAFFPESKRFFEINDYCYDAIDMLNNGFDDQEIVNKIDISLEDLLELKNMLIGYSKPKESDKIEQVSCFEDKTLDRLAINITNSCNLNCLYCYASGGTYNTKVESLTKDTVDKIFDVFYSRYEKINKVQLFGGEPLLDMDVLAYVAEKVRVIDSTRNYTTLLGVVTNGTLINQNFIDLVNKYSIVVTISYDGSKEINDILRPSKLGQTVSDLVYNNAKLLYENSKYLRGIEVTYTKQHVDNNIQIIDILRKLNDDFPGVEVSLSPVATDKNCPCRLDDLSVMSKSIDDYYNLPDRSTFKHPYVHDFRSVINYTRRYNDFICQAGVDVFSVSTNGDIYPCFILNGDKNMCMGNVYNQDFFNSDKYKSVIKELTKMSCKSKNNKCSNCFCKNICTSCIGMNKLYSNKLEINDEVCQFHKDIFETAMNNFVTKNDV